MIDSEKSDRAIDLVTAVLRRAADQVWSEVDHHLGGGAPRRSALALGLDLALGQALVVLDNGDDHHRLWITDLSDADTDRAGVSACLDLAARAIDAICETGPWRLSTAQLRVAVGDLIREAGRAGS